MPRIATVRPVGKQQTYNLWVDHPEHNYLLSNGLISKNSHAIAYSILTYWTSWLKANYTEEFFCALMSVRSQTMNAKLWATKAASYANEAQQLGVHIIAPSINHSSINFSIKKGVVLFGLGAIKNIGPSAAEAIIAARGNQPFEDIYDFLYRIDLAQVNTQAFDALVRAGAFDTLGYSRRELLENTSELYEHVRAIYTLAERQEENRQRRKENEEIIPKLERKKELKAIQRRKTDRDLTEEELRFLEETDGLRKRLMLKETPPSEKIDFSRTPEIKLTVGELLQQAKHIGCFLQVNPASILFPGVTTIESTDLAETTEIAGVVSSCKVIKTRRGRPMAFMELVDETAVAEVVIFSNVYERLGVPIEEWDVVKVYGKVEETTPQHKIVAHTIEVRKD